jgi:hypothetical protein
MVADRNRDRAQFAAALERQRLPGDGVGADAGPNAPVHTEGDVSAGQGKQTWRFLHPGYGFVRITAVTNGNAAAGTVLTQLPATVVSGATYRWSPPAWTAGLGCGRRLPARCCSAPRTASGYCAAPTCSMR